MGLKNRDDPSLSPDGFLDEYMRLRRGSVSRRHFLRTTGLGLATAMLPGGFTPSRSMAANLDHGSTVSLATWPNYHAPAVLEAFTEATGIVVDLEVFGSNEDMYARLRTGRAKWDLLIPTNYTISNYAARGLIEVLDQSKLPNLQIATQNPRLTAPGIIDGQVYALPRNWGTTGMAYNTRSLSPTPQSWTQFFEIAMTGASGRTIVHDYQLTTIGNALVALGYSFNSVDPAELAEVEKLLLELKPHLLSIDSDYQAAIRAGDATLVMCWSNDASQLHRDDPDIRYRLCTDGGEIWTDFYAIPRNAPNKAAGYALLNFLLEPAVAAKELAASGAGATDSRVLDLLPKEVVENPITYPDENALSPLEFGAAVTLTNPIRREIMERFRSA